MKNAASPRDHIPLEKMERLLDYRFAETYFLRKRRIFFPAWGTRPLTLRDVRIVKDYRDPRTRSFVAFYDLACGRRRVRVVGLVHSRLLRRYEYLVHRALFVQRARAHGFLAIPRPYYYDARLGALFVEYIAGPSLREVMERSRTLPPPLAAATVQWLNDLQRIPGGKILQLKRGPDFAPLETNLRIIRRRLPRFAPKLTRRWRSWKRRWPRERGAADVIAHGDFNPTNVVVPSHDARRSPRETPRLMVIDFGRMHRAPRLWDLAAFISHCTTSLGFPLSSSAIHRIQHALVQQWTVQTGTLAPSEQKRLRFFEQYFDLLAVTHFLVWGDLADPILKKHTMRLYRAL